MIFHGEVQPGCKSCGDNQVVAHWEHLCWDCPCFSRLRPNNVQDMLQRRLGWPLGADHDAQVLRHLTDVRRTICHETHHQGDAADAAAAAASVAAEI